MLSIGTVSSATNVQKYFIDKDNYYLTDKSEIRDSAIFYGKGADLLGIDKTKIDEKLFLELLEGKLPNGEEIGRLGDKFKHRPATDITLSAPKSISVMALVGDDKRLIGVHNKAVEKVLDKIESLYAEARKTIKGETSYEKTNNLTIALFRHTSSRDLDPQLHTHGVTLNMTERSDGKWRALSSRAKGDTNNLDHGFREQIYANQHYLGMIYTSELAKGAIDCGYEIEIKDKYGNFELKGIPEDYLKSQSKRRNEILSQAQAYGVSDAKSLSYITKGSRLKKENISPETLKEGWLNEAKENKVNLKEIHNESLNRKTKEQGYIASVTSQMSATSLTATDAINDAISHLSEYSVRLSHGNIIRQAFIFGGGKVEHEQLEAVIDLKHQKNELIGKKDSYYTTDKLISKEKDFKALIKDSKSSSWSLNINQSGIVAQSLKSHDRLQLLNVKGLKNEVSLIDNIVKQAEVNQLNVYVLHANQSRLNRLGDDVTRDSSNIWKAFKNYFKHDLLQTVGKFEHHYQSKLNHPFRSKKDDYIIVTDAQKLSYDDISRLNNLAKEGGA
ncbi:conjugative relaxase, partial [Thiotrichales bacterium 19S11-10]|nr:conjugative relaxase [Thiotrichales bacterium 19S11-10]